MTWQSPNNNSNNNGCGTGFGQDGGGYGGSGADGGSGGSSGSGGCPFGFASCYSYDNCTTDLRSDYNCGTCGHVCKAGLCNNGACGAETVFDKVGYGDVTALLAAENRLYFSQSSDLSTIAFLDHASLTYLASITGPLHVTELARGAGRTFALEPNHNRVQAINDAANSALVTFVALDGDGEALVADDSYAYVASTRSYVSDAGVDASFTEAGVLEAGDASADASFEASFEASTAPDATIADADDASLDATPDSDLDGPDALSGGDSSTLDASSDGDAWYDGAPVTDAADAQSTGYAVGRVQRVPTGGGAAEDVIVEPGRARSLALGGSTLFVGYSDPGRLYAIDTTTLGATLIAEGGFDPARLAVDGTRAYAADEAGQRVIAIGISTGTVQVITQTPTPAYDVRVDGGQLWFTTADPGQLYAWHAPNMTFIAGLLRPRTPIALDSQYLYWSSPGTGILRVAR